jgi:DNA processing protein
MDLHTAVSVSMLSTSRGRASAAFKALREYSAATLEGVLDTLAIPIGAQSDLASAARAAADAALASAPALGIEPVSCFDARYPALLNCISDPPPVLWTRGDVAVFSRPAVAVVGSRAATAYALQVSARLAGELAERGVIVTSGLARGVDSAAHRGCLDAAGATTAVLGSGLDRIYPPEHDGLARRIAERGVVVSELGPGGAPLPEHFPLRNRIISGVSLAVVVVEASENSGSLITARYALEQGRDVLAVPGSVLTGRNRGSHALLKDGAKVVETADDILEELGWPAAARQAKASRKSLNADPLLRSLQPGETYGLDELVKVWGLEPPRVLMRLTEFELAGHVAPAGGGRFVRLVT